MKARTKGPAKPAKSDAEIEAEAEARALKEWADADVERFGITPVMFHSPRWGLLDRATGAHVHLDGTAMAAQPDPARLNYFWPALEAWKDDRDRFKGLAYAHLTAAERKLAAPGCGDVALAAGLQTRAFLARYTLPAKEQAEEYRISAEEHEIDAEIAEEDGDMDTATRHRREAVDFRSLAKEYGAHVEPPPPPPPTSDAPYTLTDVGTLMDTEFNPLVFLTKGIIELTAGAFILAGKPKHGKSWLAMGLSIAGCTGEEYLGTTPAEKGQAIYLACDDDSQRRFQSRVRAIKPQGPLAGQMGLVTQWAPEATSTIDVLDVLAGKYPRLRIVVIDTLSSFRKGLRTQSPYQQEYDELKALNDWGHRHGVAVLVVHHLRKGTVDPNDPFESISGTLGLQGAVDGMMVLSRADDRDEFGPNDRKLAGFWMRSRDVEGEIGLGLELKNGRWRIDGTAADVFNAGTQRLIMQILRENDGRWMTSKEMHATGVFDCKPPSVQKAASRMATKNLIESHRGALEGKSGGGGAFRLIPGKET